MASFYGNVRTPAGHILEGIGFEIATLGRVHQTAARIAADLMAKDPSSIDWTFEITDDTGRIVLTLPLRDCLQAQASQKG